MLSPEEATKRKQELDQRRAQKAKQQQQRRLMIIIAVAVGVVLMAVSFFVSYRSGLRGDSGHAQAGNKRINILVMGVDDPTHHGSRTDTMMLVSVDPTTGDVGVLSIPRDTRVWIPDRNRWDRVNAAYAYGGSSLAMRTVSHFLQTPIEYYILTDFSGFEGIVDTLGGVEIHVGRRMYYVDNAQDLVIDIRPGSQVLDGETALHYVRFRDRLGDVSLVDPLNQQYDGRVERQRQFVMAMIREVLQPSNVTKLPSLVQQGWNMVRTNLPLDRMLTIAMAASRFSDDSVYTALVPGNSAIMGGASYWVADEERLASVLATVLHGESPRLTVEILNGNGRSGEGGHARDVLRSNGMEVVNLANADHFDYAETLVRIYDPQHQSQAEKIAHLVNGQVILDETGTQRTDATVILGRNFTTIDGSEGI